MVISEWNSREHDIVWLFEPWNCWGVIISRGAHVSLIEIPGEDRMLVENDDFEEWSERAIDFESDDDGG